MRQSEFQQIKQEKDLVWGRVGGVKPPYPFPLQRLLSVIEFFLHPKQVWLFGSRARGDFREDSDWDLLVVVSDQQAENGATDEMLAWSLRKKAGIQADIIVVSESDFFLGASVVNTLVYEVVNEGVLLVGEHK